MQIFLQLISLLVHWFISLLVEGWRYSIAMGFKPIAIIKDSIYKLFYF